MSSEIEKILLDFKETKPGDKIVIDKILQKDEQFGQPYLPIKLIGEVIKNGKNKKIHVGIEGEEEIQKLIRQIKNEYQEGIDFEFVAPNLVKQGGGGVQKGDQEENDVYYRIGDNSVEYDSLDYVTKGIYRHTNNSLGPNKWYIPGTEIIGRFHPECAKKNFAEKGQSNENNTRIKEKILRNLDKISFDQAGHLANAELLKRPYEYGTERKEKIEAKIQQIENQLRTETNPTKRQELTNEIQKLNQELAATKPSPKGTFPDRNSVPITYWIKASPYAIRLDKLIRDYLNTLFPDIVQLKIEYTKNNIFIYLHIAEISLVLGENNEKLDKLMKEMYRIINNEEVALKVNLVEVKNIYTQAQSIANLLASQLRKRSPSRLVLRNLLNKLSLEREVKGAKIQVGGRLDGGEIAQQRKLVLKKMPLSTIDSNIEVGRAEVITTYGKIEEVKKKKNEVLGKELEIFVGKLDNIRSNRISLEAVRGLMVDYQHGKKPLKSVASLRISPNHELVIQPFEPKIIPQITKKILDSQLGYKVERNTKEEVCFVLSPLTEEIRGQLIRKVNLITEEGKSALRRVRENFRNLVKKDDRFSRDQKRNYEAQVDKIFKEYQDKLITAEKKKIQELSS
ncbi:15085_t:CDS:10 [Entrophospora sp. SA101]|nr:15085_t:CDS:10 [Entrophospora sp. SA101]